MRRRREMVARGRRTLQWHEIVRRTLHEGERVLPWVRLEGLREQFEHADHLLGVDQFYVGWAREERAPHGPEVERAIARYERVLRGTYPANQLDGAPIGETMTEEEARRAFYAAVEAEGRERRERERRRVEEDERGRRE